MSLPVILTLVLTSTGSAAQGSGLFSNEEIPDEPPSSLFSDEPIPDDPAPGLLDSGSSSSSFLSSVRGTVLLESKAAVDLSFDGDSEQVMELSLGGRIELDAEISRSLSAYVAPQFTYVSAWREDGEDRQFLYLPLPEAYATWSIGAFHLRAGSMIFGWGASDFVAPNDVLNPYDLRRTLLTSPGDAKLSVPAVEAVLRTELVTMRAVIEPFFTAPEFFLTGWDSSIFQLAQGAPLLQTDLLPAASFDRVGDDAIVVDRPEDRPDNATVAGRVTFTFDQVDVSLTAVHGWDVVPELKIDPDLIFLGATLVETVTEGRPLDFTNPDILAAAARIQDTTREGRTLFTGAYRRRDLVGADLVWAIDPIILKLDVAYTFGRTLYSQALMPVRHPWLNTVVGLEYLSGEDLQIIVEVFAFTVFDVPSHYRLLLIEPLAPPPSQFDLKDRTLALPGAIAVGRYSMFDGDLDFELGLLSTFDRGDIAVIPNVRWRVDDHHHLKLGAMIFEGKEDGYGGVYSNNDQAYVGYSWSP
jgi:hypothetical protein